jgi:hypothetical protein
VVYIVCSIVSTEEVGAIGREIESRQCIAVKKTSFRFETKSFFKYSPRWRKSGTFFLVLKAPALTDWHPCARSEEIEKPLFNEYLLQNWKWKFNCDRASWDLKPCRQFAFRVEFHLARLRPWDRLDFHRKVEWKGPVLCMYISPKHPTILIYKACYDFYC